MNKRAEIFIKKNGSWDNVGYQIWIMRMADKFEDETGMRTRDNPDEFTDFLGKQEV